MKGITLSFFTLKSYTFLLLAGSLLGVHIFSLNMGGVQLSIYRALILISPLVVMHLKKSSVQKIKSGWNYSYFIFLFFWLVYSIFPLLWIKDVEGWAKMLFFLLSGCITTWFMGWHLTQKKDIIKALKIVEFFSFFFGILAVYEIITGDYFFLTEKNLIFYQEQSLINSTVGFRIPISVFGNPNNFSLFLVFTIFNSLALTKIKKKKLSRLFSLILCLFFVALLFFTQSRSGFIGLVVGALSYIILLLKVGSPKIKMIFLSFLAVSSFIVIPWFVNNYSLFEALITFDSSTTGGSDNIRINLMKNGLIYLFDHFLLGVGLGNIEYYMINQQVHHTSGIINIHNWWLEILVSSGILVFSFYTITYFQNLKKLYLVALTKFDRDYRFLSISFFSTLMAFVISSVGVSSLMYNEWFWPIMGIIMCYTNLFTKNKKIKKK